MTLHMIPVIGDGDCFFYSVYICLSHDDIYRKRVEELYKNPILSSIYKGCPFSPTGLRAIVAWSILVDSAEGCVQRERVRTLFNLGSIPELQSQTIFIRKCLHNGLIDTLLLATNMMDKSVYWADELAIAAIEFYLNIRILILGTQLNVSSGQNANSILLKLDSEHYNPLFIRSNDHDVFVFNESQTRDIIKSFNA